MKYKLIITERAEKLLDNILEYIIYNLKNSQAAKNLINEIEIIYNNLENNPMMYAYVEDTHLRGKEYRKAVISHYNYVIIYRIDEEIKKVYILGFFHELEFYQDKL